MSPGNLVTAIFRTWRGYGLRGVIDSTVRRFTRPRSAIHDLILARIGGRDGLEIGGPSEVFADGGRVAVYDSIASLDNCNFSSSTVWEGKIEAGRTFRFGRDNEPGIQFLADATDLGEIPDERYGFLLSSHTLEHVANPVRALREWHRVLERDGTLVLVVPHRDGTFDHRRPVTPLEHMLQDEASGTTEDDLTHLEEILALHDLDRDPGAGTRADFEARSRKNPQNRCLHHHVFSTERLLELIDWAGFEPIAADACRPYHIVILARKVESRPAGPGWRSSILPQVVARSPFPTDRTRAAAGSIRCLLLTRYPRKGASSRVRHLQFIPHLENHGFDVDVKSFFSNGWLEEYYRTGRKPVWMLLAAYTRRSLDLLRARRYDVVWLEKEALPFVPALFETALLGRDVPVVVDYDDATFHTYDLHRSKLVRRLLGRKIDALMRRATIVVAGNRYLAERASFAGASRIEIIPSSVDLHTFLQDPSGHSEHESASGCPSVGWIGSPGSMVYLECVREPLRRVAATAGCLRFATMGAEAPPIDGIESVSRAWSEEAEGPFLAGIDIGIMPLTDDPWSRGKCGYKLIQYMAAGKAVVASPVGVNSEIVLHGETGFLSDTDEQWIEALTTLRDNPSLRQRMGEAGRRIVEERYSVDSVAPSICRILQTAAGRS